MPVLDGSFEAFVTNLGKYNEGELVGEWVHFPTTEEEMKKVFERIGIGSKDEFGQVYEEWFITDYDCSIHGVSNLLGEYENLDKLNYLAARLDEMSRSELEHFVAIMDSGCDEVNDLDDLIIKLIQESAEVPFVEGFGGGNVLNVCLCLLQGTFLDEFFKAIHSRYDIEKVGLS